ncbi:MAG: SDR family NAD(P)-dependent oxidoreductase [Thermoleophilaceae bacterium]
MASPIPRLPPDMNTVSPSRSAMCLVLLRRVVPRDLRRCVTVDGPLELTADEVLVAHRLREHGPGVRGRPDVPAPDRTGRSAPPPDRADPRWRSRGGHFLACKHALPLMPAGGAIVLTSSTAALLPSTSSFPAYGASKAALDGVCRHVGREAAARGVRVNVVMPGLIDTPLGRLASQAQPDRDATPVPLGRHGTGWEVAEAASFLLSNAASYVSGQTLAVDGGLTNLS